MVKALGWSLVSLLPCAGSAVDLVSELEKRARRERSPAIALINMKNKEQ